MKPGDVVKLKSGGPRMTIQAKGDEGFWVCSWFNKDNEIKSAAFAADSLELYKGPVSSSRTL